jgi:hypothetical protein
MNYFNIIPEELKIIIADKLNDPYLSVMVFKFNKNEYFRHLCIEKNKLFNIYPSTIELNNRKIHWSKIYENIAYLLFCNKNISISQSIPITMIDKEISPTCELFYLLLWDFDNFYKKTNGVDLNYKNIHVLYYVLYNISIYIDTTSYIIILNNFKDYVQKYIDNYVTRYSFKLISTKEPRNKEKYVDIDNYVIYLKYNRHILVCVGRISNNITSFESITNNDIKELNKKERIVAKEKGYNHDIAYL